MSYKSKYTGPQIDNILDSVEGKQNEIEDLASIRSGAAKGATALQSEQYKGTITGVSANGTSVATSGVANIPAASTSAYGVTKLSSATNSTSTTEAATPSAVKSAYDLANSYKGTVTGVKINGTTKNPTSGVVDLGTIVTDISGKQDKLVSGTNIKTINGTSILGSGNIAISGGDETNSIYVTDFTVANLEMLCALPGEIAYQYQELEDALENKQTILVPYSNDLEGYGVLYGYVEDLMYLTVITYDTVFNVDANIGSPYLNSSMVSSGYRNLAGSIRVYDDFRQTGPTIHAPNGLHLSSYNEGTNESEMIWTETLHTFGVTCSSSELHLNGEKGIKCDSDIGYRYSPSEKEGTWDEWFWKITPDGDAKFNDVHITGNLIVDGTSGGGSSSGGSGVYAEVNHGTSDTTFTLTPNTFHVWDEVASLTLTLGSDQSGIANEFVFQFTSGATATSLTLPDDIKWANDAPPTIAENKIYQVSILKGMASVLEFSNAPSTIVFYVNGTLFNARSNMTWNDFINSEYNPDIYNDKMFVAGNYGEPKYAGAIHSEDDIEYYVIMFEDYSQVLLTDKILPTNYIAE